MSDAAKGAAAMIGACLIWGLSPIFFRAIAHVPPLEVLAHRTLWSAGFFGLVLLAQGRLVAVAGAARGRTLAVVALAAALVAANWFFFISAIQIGRALEASLGYYIFPLVAVLLGLLLGERLSALQKVAVGLAAAAVTLLTAGLGAAPWIALVLAATFGLYGLVKKRLAMGPVASVFLETALIVPLAGLWLALLHSGLAADPSGRPGAAFGTDAATSVLLALSGPVMTAIPLILFSYAARRIGLATLGLVQYLNPTLQFLIAALIFGEAFTLWHGVAFPMIWAGLALYSLELWRIERRARRPAISASTPV